MPQPSIYPTPAHPKPKAITGLPFYPLFLSRADAVATMAAFGSLGLAAIRLMM
jgi:hypothetical protein